MTNTPTPDEDSAQARTLQMERVFAASPERVFNAWTDPTILARWWGHGSYNVSSVDLDPREDGAWTIVLVNAEGTAFQVSGVYREVGAAQPAGLHLGLDPRRGARPRDPGDD